MMTSQVSGNISSFRLGSLHKLPQTAVTCSLDSSNRLSCLDFVIFENFFTAIREVVLDDRFGTRSPEKPFARIGIVVGRISKIVVLRVFLCWTILSMKTIVTHEDSMFYTIEAMFTCPWIVDVPITSISVMVDAVPNVY